MVRRRAVLCYHVKFVGVFWIFSPKMTQMRGQCLPVSCRHPGLHDHCLDESLSLSLVDDCDDSSRDADAHGCFLSGLWDAAMS